MIKSSLKCNCDSCQQLRFMSGPIRGRHATFVIMDDLNREISDELAQNMRRYYDKLARHIEAYTSPTKKKMPTLTETWESRGKVTPISELATPHLENIIKLYDREPQKYLQHYASVAERTILTMRIGNVRKELNKRKAVPTVRDVRDHRIKIEGWMRRWESPYTASFNRPMYDEMMAELIALQSLLARIENASTVS